MDKHEKWLKLANNIGELVFENNIAAVQINEKCICVIKTPNGLKACSSKCPHAGGDLSTGFLDAKGNIICPVHNYRFNLNHGRDTNDEGYFLKLFKVKEDQHGVWLKVDI